MMAGDVASDSIDANLLDNANTTKITLSFDSVVLFCVCIESRTQVVSEIKLVLSVRVFLKACTRVINLRH